jgi:hypothetical protein
MELSQRIYQGDRAREVLENEAFVQAFADIEQELTDTWKTSPARDESGREKIWLMLSLLGKLKSTFQTSLETGTLAKLELQHKQTLAERARLVKSALWE